MDRDSLVKEIMGMSAYQSSPVDKKSTGPQAEF